MADDPNLSAPDPVSPAQRYNDELLSKPESETEKLARVLRETKPSWQTDGLGLRGPQQPRNPEAERRTEFPLGSVTREPRQPFFPERPVEATAVGGTAILNHPFRVTSAVVDDQPVLKVYPGKIASIVPTINGVTLDNDPSPSFPVTTSEPFSLFLRAKIGIDNDNLFRSYITEVKVIDDNDPESVPDIDPNTSELPEMQIVFDNPTQTTGHFYIRIADINIAGAGIVTVKLQWLFNSYSSFVATAKEVIPVL